MNVFLHKVWQRLRRTPYKGIKKAWGIVSKPGGIHNILDISQNSARISHQYRQWLQKYSPTISDLVEMEQQIATLEYTPKISVLLPVFNTEERCLRGAIESVREQVYPHWELCIADDASTESHIRLVLEEYSKLDARIKIVFRETNGHISAASNTALSLATGEFVALLDHDDEIWPNALFEAVKLLNNNPNADLIYTDEDKLELDGSHVEPFFKPAWSPNLLLCINYITHFAILRKEIVETTGGFRNDFVGSQDYDLFLRFTQHTDRVFHIPKVLYSWRKIPASTALISDAKNYALDASLRALAERVQHHSPSATIVPGNYPPFLRIRYPVNGSPRVSVVFLLSGSSRKPLKYLQNLRKNTAYKNYEIISIVNNGYDNGLLHSINDLCDDVVTDDTGVSPGECFNIGAGHANGDYLLFTDGGFEPLNNDWLNAMLEYAQCSETGCVGAKILSKNGRLVSAGIALGINGVAGHPGQGMADVPQVIFYLNLKDAVREVSAVSSVCLMIRKTVYQQVNGFDLRFQDDFYDVDLCLRVAECGYQNLYTPYANLRINHQNNIESETNQADALLLQQKWGSLLQTDPYYNPNFTRIGEDFGLRIYGP